MTEKKKFAKLLIDDKELLLPIVEGTEHEMGIDIANLRKETGYITVDPSFLNTGSCYSSITYIDGEKGVLSYRGIKIEDLVKRAKFIETAYLLLHGSLPSMDERAKYAKLLNRNSLLHEDMRHFFDGFPRGAHPMHIMATMINAFSTFYPNVDSLSLEEDIDECATRLIATIRTIAAFAYKKSIGEPLVYPKHNLSYCANFLNMMFDSTVAPYVIRDEVVDILDLLLVLHADHEQNCSTTAVRTVGSAQVNLYSTISAGISALSGPLHGGANQAVLKMLHLIQENDGDVKSFIEKVKNKTNNIKLMGFGHRVYKTHDPRAIIIKEACHRFLKRMKYSEPLLDIAVELEAAALKDSYFIERNLYPNVDFYSGLIYRAVGIPENMFTVMFALGRLPGWIAHWKEMIGKNTKISRPRQIYIGKKVQ